MSSNKSSTAIKLATAALTLSIAGHATAIEVSAGDAKVDIYGYARLNVSYDINEDCVNR